MTPEKAETIKAYAEAIAALLYEEAEPEQLTTLAGIEKTVRDQLKTSMSRLTLVFFCPHGNSHRVRANPTSQKHPWRAVYQ